MKQPYAALNQSIETEVPRAAAAVESVEVGSGDEARGLTFKQAAKLTYATQVLRKRGRVHQLMRSFRNGALLYSGLVLTAGHDDCDEAELRRALSSRDEAAREDMQQQAAAETEAAVSDRHANIVLGVVSTNAFLVLCCNTMFLPALQTVQKELNTSHTLVAWAISAYMLSSSFQPLLVGPLADVSGGAG